MIARCVKDLPTGTVTFLFTDVEGSTKLLHELGAEEYAQALREHRRIVREACAAEGGVEVDTQADAFFFAFASAPRAVAAAEVITDALAPGRVHLRIGLHTGAPVVTDEGYVGNDVHYAARVAASGHGGQVVLSRATSALLHAHSLTDLGEHRLGMVGQPGWELFGPWDDGEAVHEALVAAGEEFGLRLAAHGRTRPTRSSPAGSPRRFRPCTRARA
jgi:class 3 adenylate cyclase